MPTVQSSEPMTAAEYVKLRDRIGFTGRGFARWTGHNERSERQWSSGAADVPHGVATLLRLLSKLKISADRAVELVPPSED